MFAIHQALKYKLDHQTTNYVICTDFGVAAEPSPLKKWCVGRDVSLLAEGEEI
jgi:hypothetical protein